MGWAGGGLKCHQTLLFHQECEPCDASLPFSLTHSEIGELWVSPFNNWSQCHHYCRMTKQTNLANTRPELKLMNFHLCLPWAETFFKSLETAAIAVFLLSALWPGDFKWLSRNFAPFQSPFPNNKQLLHSGCTFGPPPLRLGLCFRFSLNYWMFSLNQHSSGCLVLIIVFYNVFFWIALQRMSSFH